MKRFPYCSAFINDLVSREEATDTTSSQILLSRDIAGADNESNTVIPPRPGERTSVVTIFENNSIHVMTLGEPARSSLVRSTLSLSENSDESLVKEEQHCLRISTPDITAISSFRETEMPSTLHFPHYNYNGLEIESSLESPVVRGSPSPDVRDQKFTEDDMPNSSWKGKEVDRGRTIGRTPRQLNPLSRAQSRRHLDDISIELDTKTIQKRPSRSGTFHLDPTTPSAVLDDKLLEPCPEIPACSLTETLSEDKRIAGKRDTPDPITGLIRTNNNTFYKTDITRSQSAGPARTLTTAFDDLQPLQLAPKFPPETLREYPPNVSHAEYLGLKSSSLDWSRSTQTPEEHLEPSVASQLPAEIVHQIYRNLGPFDFNSARHTCRVWYIYSLDKALLEAMLKRGGWSSNMRDSLTTNHVIETGIRANDEWLMSKMIARECALGPDWTGNGLSSRHSDIDFNSNPSIGGVQDNPTTSPFVLAATTDFGEIGTQYLTNSSGSGMTFTISVCGKYLMVANGCLIYIYQLNKDNCRKFTSNNSKPGSLRPVTSIICPRRVLACSMDTSSQRHAVAVLLDGRMGLVCDLSNMGTNSPQGPSTAASSSQYTDRGSPVAESPNAQQGITINSPATDTNGRFTQPPFIFSTVEVHNNVHNTTLQQDIWSGLAANCSPDHSQTLDSSRQPETLGLHKRITSGIKSMPLEVGPRSIYRNLCSSDDAPRSVAICPQRRCVAFGCSAGIELHWIDALTGQDLNRWFPLTAPSDYLYFLPPRRGIDSAKKLRLISSAARPGEAPALADRFRNNSGSKTRLKSIPYASQERIDRDRGIAFFGRMSMGIGIRGDVTDHYRAIPLSDGYHILFTDPATGLLCLGSDAPIGGPTKLLRKIWFVGPQHLGSSVAYAGGSDLQYGVRIVAAYGPPHEQKIWLFSVPVDVFTDTWSDPATSLSRSLDFSGRAAAFTGGEWMHWWKDEGLQDWLNYAEGPNSGKVLNRGLWPVEVRGQEIGNFSNVVDLAVDSGPDMTVWAFGKSGVAKVWKVDCGKNDKTENSIILRDGTVTRENYDGDLEIGDMVDSLDSPDSLDLLTPPRVTPPMFDGNRSSQDLSSVRMGRWSVQYDSIQYDTVQYDADGDILMADLQEPSILIGETSEDGDTEVVSNARDEDSLGFESSMWMGRAYIQRHGHGDTVEELTGIARIDIEIR